MFQGITTFAIIAIALMLAALFITGGAGPSTTCPGDFDGNRRVNIADFLAFVVVFGTSSADANYNAQMDFDSSGRVDITDFLAFAEVFGTECGGDSSGTSTTGLFTRTLSQDGITREYILYVPEAYDGTSKVPLMLNFHGYGGIANQYLKYADMRPLADMENFILVYPQGTLLNGDPHWNSGLESDTNKSDADDFGFVEALIDEICSNYNIDSTRVYSCGYSNGAFFTYALACYHSDKIAAIGSVAGTMMAETHNNCRPSHPTAMINIHGTSDSVVPYGGGSAGLLSIDEVLAYWTGFNNTSTTPIVNRMNDRGTTIEHYSYTDGDNNTSVGHYKVIDGGHVWFDMSYDGSNTSRLIWDFVSRYDIGGGREGQRGIGEAGVLKEGFAQIIGARFLDIDGNIRRLGDENGTGPAALVFVDDRCPVAARYLGEMNDFTAAAEAVGIDFYLVVSSPDRTWTDARKLRDDFGLRAPVLFDPSGDLATRLAPVTLAEAFVVNERDRMIYRGRIDDRFAGIGQLRQVIRHHDLLDVFKIAHDPQTEGRATVPIGCYFNPWKPVDQREVTYTRDIEPILAANCVACHQAGGVAPFAVQTYEQAASWSFMLSWVTTEGRMPPWRPEPRYGRFRDERYLSQTQIDLISAWTNTEDAQGPPEDRVPEVQLPDPGWRHGLPDLVLPMTEPFDVPARGDDVYRYFVIPSGLTVDKTVTAIDFRPGDASVVHHANFFADYSGKARREDAKDDAPGFSVFGTGSFMSYDNTDENSFGIGGWAPGAEPYTLPDGVGLWLPKGGDIVIEIHYKLNGKATTDQSQIGFYFADRPTPRYIDGLLIGTQDLNIPAGEKTYIRHISMNVPVGFRLVDMMPHMHYIGSKARMIVTYPDGREQSIVGIEDWDLRWQNIYLLRTPLHIPAGSKLDAWFVWDNSADNFDNPFNPPRRLTWGWKSEDEMAEVWLGVILDDPRRRQELIEASWATWYNADSRPLPQVSN